MKPAIVLHKLASEFRHVWIKSPFEINLWLMTRMKRVFIYKQKNIDIVCIPPPPFCWGREMNVLPNFQKEGAWQDLNFKRGFAGKEGVTFFRGACKFYKKTKLKSEIINNKKSL